MDLPSKVLAAWPGTQRRNKQHAPHWPHSHGSISEVGVLGFLALPAQLFFCLLTVIKKLGMADKPAGEVGQKRVRLDLGWIDGSTTILPSKRKEIEGASRQGPFLGLPGTWCQRGVPMLSMQRWHSCVATHVPPDTPSSCCPPRPSLTRCLPPLHIDAGVSGAGLMTLQAELYQAQESIRLKKEGGEGLDMSQKNARRKAGVDLTSLINRKNAGVEERDARDKLHVKVGRLGCKLLGCRRHAASNISLGWVANIVGCLWVGGASMILPAHLPAVRLVCFLSYWGCSMSAFKLAPFVACQLLVLPTPVPLCRAGTAHQNAMQHWSGKLPCTRSWVGGRWSLV